MPESDDKDRSSRADLEYGAEKHTPGELIHSERHPLAGTTVEITSGKHLGERFLLEDWWDRVGGKSWKFSEGNPACMIYAIRSVADQLPADDEVVYGKIGTLGHLIHVSELAEESRS